MFDVKATIQKRKAQGKSVVTFQVLGYQELYDVTTQLTQLGYEYKEHDLREQGMQQTPYDVVVSI